MSINPNIQLNDDNYKFIMQNKTTNLNDIDVSKDGHLVKVTWFKWVIRWIINKVWSGSVDQKVHQAFCNAISQKFPAESANPLPFDRFKNIVNRFTYLSALKKEGSKTTTEKVDDTSIGILKGSKNEDNKRYLEMDDDHSFDDVSSDEDSDSEEVTKDEPKFKTPPVSNGALTLEMMANMFELHDVSLVENEEENVEKLVDVLVDFTKYFSVADVVKKAVGIVNINSLTRPVLTNMIQKKIETKIEENEEFFYQLHQDNQDAFEAFRKEVEERNKVEDMDEEESDVEEVSQEDETPEVDPNWDILEEGLQPLSNIAQEADVDFDLLLITLNEAWEKIQHYPKPDQGIPAGLDSKMTEFVDNLPQHVAALSNDQFNQIKQVWNQITNHLGIDIPIEKDTTEAEKTDPLQAFIIEYLVRNWNAGQEMGEDEWAVREFSIAESVKEVFQANQGLQDFPMIVKIREALNIDKDTVNELARQYVSMQKD